MRLPESLPLRPWTAAAPAAPAPPAPAQPQDRVYNTAPEPWLARDPRGLALGAGVGAALGAGLGVALGGAVAAGIGGAVGAAIGGLLGRKRRELAYDLRGIGRQVANRVDTTRGRVLHGLDDAWRRVRGRQSPPPLLASDLRATGRTGDAPRLYDGYDSSRDLASLASREGAPDQPYRFQIEFAHLRPGAEHGHLDTTLALEWDGGGRALVRVDDDHHAVVTDGSGRVVGRPGMVEHSTRYSHLSFGVDKDVLRGLGWKDGQPLRLRASTMRDGAAQVRDTLDARTDLLASGQLFRWEGRTIYYAITDRFHNGDRTNDQWADPAQPQRFHGGDWQGLIEKLDYLDGLGVDCLWISCPYENDRAWLGMDGYHGYWPHDFRRTEPSFGDLAKLQELTRKAHDRGIKVMLDVVVNHTGYEHPWRRDPSKDGWFHRQGKIDFVGQHEMEHGSLAGLPDLAQERPEVAAELLDVHRQWLKDSGVDAFRVDAVRHVPEDFLREFNDTMHQGRPEFMTLGEVFWRDPNYVAGYQNRAQDSMFDFPLAYAIRDVFASDPDRGMLDRWRLSKRMTAHNIDEARRLMWFRGGESMQRLARALRNDASYDNPRKLSTFLDNHDMLRFMADCAGDERKLRIATAFLMACRGMPTVYYGTEVAMDGMFEENRKDMPWGANPALTAEFRRLIGARAGSEALRLGTHQDLCVSRDTYAFARVRPGEEVVCAFNNSEEEREIVVPLQDTQIPDGAALHALLDGSSLRTQDGSVTVRLPAKGYAYYGWKA